MATNKQAIQAWAAGTPAKANSLTTDGRNLYSYALLIGTTDANGRKIVTRYKRSKTTSTHTNAAARVAHEVVEG